MMILTDLVGMKYIESALILSAFKNRLRAGLVCHTLQTNPAYEQSINIKWSESPWNQYGRKGKGNNNLCLTVVKTNRSTLHTVNNIQQSATQGSTYTTHRLSRRTAATTRFSPEGIGSQTQTASRFCQHPIR